MVKFYKFDHLTGMKQRYDFEHESNHKFNSQEFYLTMTDATGLHSVNRKYGYAAGDALIRQIAMDIKHSDGLWECYRVGGDEFMSLHFDKPNMNILNATSETVYSGNHESLNDMVSTVDILVTSSKARLGRRRNDSN